MPSHPAAQNPAEAAAHRRPRIVVAGEFGSGKSSVVNAVLRRLVLPPNTGRALRPVISVTHAADLAIHCADAQGRASVLRSAEELGAQGSATRLTIAAPMPFLPGVELVELPFYHVGAVDAAVLEVMARADLLIWVTIASQAWRLSEKAIIERLPREGRRQRILAISRADKLRSFGDWDKIEARLQKESARYFSEIVFMRASPALIGQSAGSDAAWAQTGGHSIVQMALERFGASAQRQLPAVLPEPPVEEPAAAAPDPAPETPRPHNVIELHTAAKPAAAAASEVVPDAAPEPAAAAGEELSVLLDSLAGLHCAGIAETGAAGVLRVLADRADTAQAFGRAAASVLRAHALVAGVMPAAGPVEEILTTVGNQTILVRPLERGSDRFLYLVLQRDRTSPAIARVVAQRVAAVLGRSG